MTNTHPNTRSTKDAATHAPTVTPGRTMSKIITGGFSAMGEILLGAAPVEAEDVTMDTPTKKRTATTALGSGANKKVAEPTATATDDVTPDDNDMQDIPEASNDAESDADDTAAGAWNVFMDPPHDEAPEPAEEPTPAATAEWPTPTEAAKVPKKAAKTANEQSTPATEPKKKQPTKAKSYAETLDDGKTLSHAHDVGFHPAADVDLLALQQQAATGVWTYSAVVACATMPRRATLGHLLMNIGPDASTKEKLKANPKLKYKFDEKAVLAAVLHANQLVPASVVPLLADLITVNRIPRTNTLKWDVATPAALEGLLGRTFDIPVAQGVTQRCMMTKVGVLDACFFIDIPTGFQSLEEETAFCNFIYAVEPRLFYATAVTAAASTGLRGARFRLYFRGLETPAFLKVGDKCADELMIFRRWHRIYSKDHESAFERKLRRVNLETLAMDMEYNLSLSTGPLPQTPKPTQQPGSKPVEPAAKKARGEEEGKTKPVPSTPTAKWTAVTRRQKRDADSTTKASQRPWVTKSFYAVLDTAMTLDIKKATTVHAGATFETYVPVAARTGLQLGAGHAARIDSTKVSLGGVRRFAQSVDQVLDEAIAGNKAAAAMLEHHAVTTADEMDNKRFDLVELTNMGCVDAACRHIQQQPLAAGAQLQAMARNNRTAFEHFVRQRMLNRLLRATFGNAKPFDVLYKEVVGANFSNEGMTSYLNNVQTGKLLPRMSLRDAHADEEQDVLTSLAAEELIALAEVVLAVSAPLVYANDAVVAYIARTPVKAIAMMNGVRALSSATLLSFFHRGNLAHAPFCQSLWQQTQALIELATTDGTCEMLDDLDKLNALVAAKDWPFVGTRQNMASRGDGPLEVGDLDDLWEDPSPSQY
ncbi:hypothetical protein SDRG_08710 [Saprolegnia diclina VS20]|uniref:Uncharacterized protein n=1 Tax=Saprolegnia diclina (strain VS20) TaxID=1156394 RepID=T0Q6X1_SAPDV|nr:hypothetical protein SDRG_08710 [Saprolegnia diclina VS20]EQC33604.1 hypothetical protein SDRG_08710 [Saprolegnia diclina VS20]|eukprot:XP_008612827.1 hypothetical protein SDRG_08710 [Saprolegnia diclina VS20]